MEPNNLIDRNILSELFIRFPELKATQIARGVGINPSLMHHYLNGSKTPSPARIIEIEEFLHKLGEELIKLKL